MERLNANKLKATAKPNKTKQPLKVVYISNPMKVEVSPAEFPAVVQKLTGQYSDVAKIFDYQSSQTATVAAVPLQPDLATDLPTVADESSTSVGFPFDVFDDAFTSQILNDHERYPPYGPRPINTENGVQWDRFLPVDTPSHDLYVSDCLNKLHPGNHIEVQWRKNKEFPYGWWYGIVGHLDSCEGLEHHCHCHDNDTIILEFNNYTPGSRWRRKVINRKNHREDGDETDGFYGGIRKLPQKDEISTCRRLWPSEVLE